MLLFMYLLHFNPCCVTYCTIDLVVYCFHSPIPHKGLKEYTSLNPLLFCFGTKYFFPGLWAPLPPPPHPRFRPPAVSQFLGLHASLSCLPVLWFSTPRLPQSAHRPALLSTCCLLSLKGWMVFPYSHRLLQPAHRSTCLSTCFIVTQRVNGVTI